MRTADGPAFDEAGAAIVGRWLVERPTALVMPAVGRTPAGLYARLGMLRRDGRLDTSAIRVAQLDEYVRIGEGDPRSLLGWLLRDFCEPLAVRPDRIVRFDPWRGMAACRAHAAAIRAAGGVDIAILGLGPNGHLGFNEPPSDANAETRVVSLAQASLVSNRAYWDPSLEVPRRAMTSGMDLLLAARQTLLVVSGVSKAAILRRTLDGPVTPDVPATFLRDAPNVTLLADAGAWLEGPVDGW